MRNPFRLFQVDPKLLLFSTAVICVKASVAIQNFTSNSSSTGMNNSTNHSMSSTGMSSSTGHADLDSSSASATGSHKPPVGAIVGGVLGGIAAFCIAVCCCIRASNPNRSTVDRVASGYVAEECCEIGMNSFRRLN